MIAKRKKGRPALGDNAKTATLTVRLSVRERAAFVKRAKAAGLPLSVWLAQPRRDELNRRPRP